jgi:hypothetical protein
MARNSTLLMTLTLLESLAGTQFSSAFAAGTTYYVSQADGDDSRDGQSPQRDGGCGPWKSLARASAVTYGPGDRLLLKCGDAWNEPLTLRGSGTAENRITVASYGDGERPYIRRTPGGDTACIVIEKSGGYRLYDLELGFAQFGVRVNLGGKTRQDMENYLLQNCFFHDIDNPRDAGGNWGWAIRFFGPGRPQHLVVKNCIGLRTQAFLAPCAAFDMLVDGNTISHTCFNQVGQDWGRHMDITNNVFVYNYPWTYSNKELGITQVLAGNLQGDDKVRNNVSHNEFGWPGDYPGAPDGCGYDFEDRTGGVIFQHNFVHDSFGEAVLFMQKKDHQYLLFDGNIFRNNERFRECWKFDVHLEPSITGNGTFSNNTFFPRPGKRAFAAKPECFTYRNNDEDARGTFAAMPLVSRIEYRKGARVYTLACATPGATIRYTTDGSLPNAASMVYKGPVAVRRSGMLNAKTFKTGCYPSYVNALAVEMRGPEGRGPTAWWKLDEAVGGVVKDSASTSDGQMAGGVHGSTRPERGLTFDGAAGCVTFPSGRRRGIADTFSVAFWAEAKLPRDSLPEASSGAAGRSGQRFALGPAWGDLRAGEAGIAVSVGTNGVSVFESADNHLPPLLVDDCALPGWNHIAVVWRARQPTLYLNAVFEKAGCRSGITLVYQGKRHTLYFNDALEKGDRHNERTIHPLFNLGGMESGWFQGKLADVRVYDRALSDAEIQELAAGQ